MPTKSFTATMGGMRIEDSNGREIVTLDDWATLYDTPKQRHHWKEHRSAYSAAEFMLNRDGGAHIAARAFQVLNCRVSLDRAIPELELKFDDLGRGRFHDLGIYGETESGQSLFIGVEAKVNEAFGDPVQDTYRAAINRRNAGKSTNAPERIERLLHRNFGQSDIAKFDVRYQLLYATVGTLAAKADRTVVHIIVFRTPLYDESIGAKNYRDYMHFLDLANAQPIAVDDPDLSAHRVTIDAQELVCLYECIELFPEA